MAPGHETSINMQTTLTEVGDSDAASGTVIGPEELITLIAHELRSPLAAMENVLQICRRTAHGSVLELRAPELLLRQLQKATRLVDDLLNLCRMAARLPDVRNGDVDLVQIVRDAADELRYVVSARNQVLSLDVASDPIPIYGDSLWLGRIVTNLLDNSSKYTPTGGRIDVSLASQNEEAVLRIRDNGRGISHEDLERIFELFFRAEHDDGKIPFGIGVGLALARWIAEQHGGTISARSDGRDRGAEFTVRLPVSLDTHNPPSCSRRDLGTV
jgi:signal transduction histidine kinase